MIPSERESHETCKLYDRPQFSIVTANQNNAGYNLGNLLTGRNSSCQKHLVTADS